MARPLLPEFGHIPRGRTRRNILVLVGYVLFLVAVVLIHARVFQYLMAEYENQPDHSFINGVYWTITTMTTLGYGDITFESHAGQLFSAWVTLSGFVFLLILLPFGILSVVFAPWLENILCYRPRTRLKRAAKGHVVICGWDAVTEALAKSLTAAGLTYVTVVPDVEQVRHLDESGVGAVHGTPTDAEALRRARVEAARMVVANMSHPDNVNLVLTTASLCSTPVAALVIEPERAELMNVAGAAHVIALRETLGNYLAVRAATRGAAGHVVDSLGDLRVGEIPSHGTPFVGISLRDSGIREKTGVSVIGMNVLDERIMILGHGTVGSAPAALLRRMGVPHVVIDRDAHPDPSEPNMIRADASHQSVLEQAGIPEAAGLMVTTNDDGVNVFLTLAGRQVNPHVRIAARANPEANVAELYAAGADFVVSHSSVGASILTNLIIGRKNVFLAEGVHVFWRQVPASLHRQTLASSGLRSLTGATVVAIQKGRDSLNLDLAPDTVLDRSTALILVGTPESEALFSRRYGKRDRPAPLDLEPCASPSI